MKRTFVRKQSSFEAIVSILSWEVHTADTIGISTFKILNKIDVAVTFNSFWKKKKVKSFHSTKVSGNYDYLLQSGYGFFCCLFFSPFFFFFFPAGSLRPLLGINFLNQIKSNQNNFDNDFQKTNWERKYLLICCLGMLACVFSNQSMSHSVVLLFSSHCA